MPFSFRGLFGRINGGNHGSHRRAYPSPHRHSADGANHRARTHDTASRPSAVQSESGASAIPSAGIRAGEIIGHRLWWVVQQDGTDWLRSLAHPLLWVPGEPVRGNPQEIVARAISRVAGSNFAIVREIWGGVYSYPTSGELSREIAYWSRWGSDIGSALVCGTVKLWGEVVEHREGYRAEYAKVHSLRAVVWGEVDLAALRRRYLPRR